MFPSQSSPTEARPRSGRVTGSFPRKPTPVEADIPIHPSVSSERFKAGMRCLASGVSLLTTESDGIWHGLVATAVSSLAGDPPSLITCVNRSASAHDPMSAARSLCVNLLGTGSHDIVSQFSESDRRPERFRTGLWSPMTTGAPALHDALASLDCQVERIVEYGTHSIFIARVVDLRLADERSGPMIYFDRSFAQIAKGAS